MACTQPPSPAVLPPSGFHLQLQLQLLRLLPLACDALPSAFLPNEAGHREGTRGRRREKGRREWEREGMREGEERVGEREGTREWGGDSGREGGDERRGESV